jgi:hypothetical protein
MSRTFIRVLSQCFSHRRYALTFSNAKIEFLVAEVAQFRLFNRFFKARLRVMWHLIEDFFDQNILMKAFIGWGWLSVLIMIFSFVQQAAA